MVKPSMLDFVHTFGTYLVFFVCFFFVGWWRTGVSMFRCQSDMVLVRQITGIILVNLDLWYIENVLTDFDSSGPLLKETS